MLEKMFEFTLVSEWKNCRRQMHSKSLVSDQNNQTYLKKNIIEPIVRIDNTSVE